MFTCRPIIQKILKRSLSQESGVGPARAASSLKKVWVPQNLP
jgi:hypothetical protein